ncbi:MAG: hypothetical protein ABR555_08530 [Pyrinomonadaceae bacterium]
MAIALVGFCVTAPLTAVNFCGSDASIRENSNAGPPMLSFLSSDPDAHARFDVQPAHPARPNRAVMRPADLAARQSIVPGTSSSVSSFEEVPGNQRSGMPETGDQICERSGNKTIRDGEIKNASDKKHITSSEGNQIITR